MVEELLKGSQMDYIGPFRVLLAGSVIVPLIRKLHLRWTRRRWRRRVGKGTICVAFKCKGSETGF